MNDWTQRSPGTAAVAAAALLAACMGWVVSTRDAQPQGPLIGAGLPAPGEQSVTGENPRGFGQAAGQDRHVVANGDRVARGGDRSSPGRAQANQAAGGPVARGDQAAPDQAEPLAQPDAKDEVAGQDMSSLEAREVAGIRGYVKQLDPPSQPAAAHWERLLARTDAILVEQARKAGCDEARLGKLEQAFRKRREARRDYMAQAEAGKISMEEMEDMAIRAQARLERALGRILSPIELNGLDYQEARLLAAHGS